MMNKQEIQYERTINSSYMKVSALEESNLDVRIMLKRDLEGLISVERCYINGKSQYWYDISGKQALESFIKINTLEYSLFEVLILRICEQLELLEWNLLNVNGLVLDPEFIFLNHKGDEISFVFNPETSKNILKELQKLLEYLLSKLNHSDIEIVQGAYEIYELSLNEGCQMKDLKDLILKRRMGQKKEYQIQKEYQVQPESEVTRVAESECVYGKEQDVETKGNRMQKLLEDKLSMLCMHAKEILVRHPKDNIPTIVYPEDEEETIDVTCHPTVCIATVLGEPRGVLIYEGIGDYPDFELEQTTCVIGKSSRARFQIQRETISNFHAKIDYSDGYYIEDMNSTNGTFVNDDILNYRDRKFLNSGDVIRFADIKYRFL